MVELRKNNFIVKTTKLRNVLYFEPKIFRDHRGDYFESYNEREYTEAIRELTGETVKFLQDDFSQSRMHVLRGIHGDSKTWKLISCPSGAIYVVIVNCDSSSANFGKWQAFNLSEKNRAQVLVPPMYGTSHLVLTKEALFHYKQSTYYDPANLRQFSYKFNDPRFNIWWPIKNPILSQRDESGNTNKVQQS